MKRYRQTHLEDRRADRDPIETRMEAALHPGRYIPYGEASGFACGLDEVESEMSRLIPSEAARAVTLYETFLAGCHAKAEEIDDSGDSLGMFISTLLGGWVRARQAAASEPDETAHMMVAWMADDPYGYFSRLDKDVAPELDEAGLIAFESRVRERLDRDASSADRASATDYRRRRWIDALRVILVARKDLDAYIRLCEEIQTTEEDCLAIGKMLVARGSIADALTWVERGLAMGREARYPASCNSDLEKMRRELLKGLGRNEESLQSAWAEFQKYPSRFKYDELVRYVPVGEEDTWRQKAVDTAGEGRLDTLIGFWVEMGEFPRLAQRLRGASNGELEGISHYITEKAAEGLAEEYPDVAARVYRALGMRVLHSKKSAYYQDALDNFQQAMECYRRAGMSAAWEDVVADVFAQHSRKSSFVPGFKKLVSGQRPAVTPTFLEQARAKWLKPPDPGT